MTTISNLAVSISEMPEEQLFNFIRTLRENRRKSMLVTTTKKVSSTTSRTPATINIESLMSKISETDKENLLQILEGKLNG
jgi:hypothetical protein